MKLHKRANIFLGARYIVFLYAMLFHALHDAERIWIWAAINGWTNSKSFSHKCFWNGFFAERILSDAIVKLWNAIRLLYTPCPIQESLA